YSVDADTDAERVGTLTIAGITFTVDQAVNSPCMLAITSGNPPSGTLGQAYSFTITSNTPGTNFTIASGSLPSGLTLSTGGVISGVPSAVGTFGFTITAADGNGCTDSQTYTLNVGKADQTITFGSLDPKTFGDAPFTVSAAASSGLAVSYIVASGPAVIS